MKSSNQLWRPSEQVLHLLTECKQQPVVFEQILETSNANREDQHPWIAGGRRQAPGVWRPPIAMKPKLNCSAPEPLDDWQLPQEQPKLPESFFLGDEQQEDDHHQQQHHHEDDEDQNESESDPASQHLDFDNSNNHASDNEQDLLPPSGSQLINDVESPPATLVESSSFTFMKQQQVLTRAPLFSGLGSVSFGAGGGFSAPQAPASSIFSQCSGFGVLRSKEDEEKKQVRATRSSSQRPALSGKGSSDSQLGFKPSELQGKSFMDKKPPLEHPGKAPAPPSASKTPRAGRKPRTRPLDLLMTAIKATGPKSKTNQEEALQTRSSARIKNMKTRKSLEQKKKQHQEEEDEEEDDRRRKNSKRAYFPHTGAWIAQKKSSRHAKNAFRRENEEEDDGDDDEYVGGASRLKASGGNVITSGKPVTKKRSLTAMSQELVMPRKNAQDNDETSGDEKRKGSVDHAKAPGARSKRGRKPRVLPPGGVKNKR